MLNHITIMGRLVRDVELRRTGSGIACANFTVAVDRDGNKRKTAEIVANNCYFGGSKNEGGAQGGTSYGNQSQSGSYGGYVPVAVNPGAGDYPELTDDDAQLPF